MTTFFAAVFFAGFLAAGFFAFFGVAFFFVFVAAGFFAFFGVDFFFAATFFFGLAVFLAAGFLAVTFFFFGVFGAFFASGASRKVLAWLAFATKTPEATARLIAILKWTLALSPTL